MKYFVQEPLYCHNEADLRMLHVDLAQISEE